MPDEKAIIKAAEALLSKGIRPTIRAVYDYLYDRRGSAPSFRDLASVLKAWRAQQTRRSSRKVTGLAKRYQRLDPLEQLEFLDETDLMRKPGRE